MERLCAELVAGDRKVRVFIDDPADHIQKNWAAGHFYETGRRGMLSYVASNKARYVGGTVIDVGACIGNHALFFAALLDAVVLAIEPYPPSFEHLLINIAKNPDLHIIPFNHAAGVAMGQVRVAPYGDNIGMVRVSDKGELARCVALDRYAHIFDNIVLVKIDAEGYNVPIIDGMRDLLRTHTPDVFIECDDDGHLEDTDAAMAHSGYHREPRLRLNPTPTYLWRKSGHQ